MVISGRLYFATQPGNLYCFSTTAPYKRLWWKYLGGKTTASPAYDQDGHTIIISTYKGTVWAFDAAHGTLRWRSKALGNNAQFYGTPAVYGSRVVVASKANGKIYCLNRTSGKVLWTYSGVQQGLYASPAVWKSTIYIGTKGGKFLAVDVRTGKLKWQKTYASPIFGSATVLNSIVYFSSFPIGAQHGTTYAVDGNDHQKWSWPDGCYSPVTATSSVILVTGHHTVYAFAPGP